MSSLSDFAATVSGGNPSADAADSGFYNSIAQPGTYYDANGNLVDSAGNPVNSPDLTSNSVGDTGPGPADPNAATNYTIAGGGSPSGSTGGNNPVPGTSSVISNGLSALGINNPVGTAQNMAALAAAGMEIKDSGQYITDANNDAAVANPFGQYRNQAGQSLMNLEANPSLVANTPGYQFAMNQALTQAMNKMQASGLTGSTQLAQGEENAASGLAQQTYNTTVNNLMNQAGAQFSPAAAAQLLAQGQTNAMNAQASGVNALFTNINGAKSPTGTTTNGTPSNSNGPSVGMPNLNTVTSPPSADGTGFDTNPNNQGGTGLNFTPVGPDNPPPIDASTPNQQPIDPGSYGGMNMDPGSLTSVNGMNQAYGPLGTTYGS